MAGEYKINFGPWQEPTTTSETYWYTQHDDQWTWKTTSTADTTWIIYRKEYEPSIFIEERWKLVAEEINEY